MLGDRPRGWLNWVYRLFSRHENCGGRWEERHTKGGEDDGVMYHRCTRCGSLRRTFGDYVS